MALALLGGLAAFPAAAQTSGVQTLAVQQLLPDPGLSNPRLRFGDGKSAQGAPEISPILPDMPGPASGWDVLQWSQPSLMQADHMTHLPGGGYEFAAPDGHAHLRITRDRAGQFVYNLQESGGTLTGAGGSNIFLSADTIGDARLDRTMMYHLRARLTRAEIHADTPQAQRSGAVLAQAFSGLVLQWNDPATHQTATLFLQIPLANSRDDRGEYRACSGGGEGGVFIWGATLDHILPFAYRVTPVWRDLQYNLGFYLCTVLSRPYGCGGAIYHFPRSAWNFADWRVKNLYVGLETENRDLRANAPSHAAQGQVDVALSLADLSLTRDPTAPFTPAICRQHGLPAPD